MKKKCIAVIPARGGSKRIHQKNIKVFFGKPLIAYSIENALNSNLFDKVIVSTDDEEIAKIALEYGAEVPFIRPKKLGDDLIGIAPVIQHAVDYLLHTLGIDIDYVCTIYATAPLLEEKYLKQGYEEIKKNTAKKAFSVTSMPSPIQRAFKITSEGRCEMFTPDFFYSRSQDLDDAYHDAGQFSWNNLKIESDKIPYGEDSIPIIIPRHLAQDIDTLEDWKRVELMYYALYK